MDNHKATTYHGGRLVLHVRVGIPFIISYSTARLLVLYGILFLASLG
jgi:hypothetical protein